MTEQKYQIGERVTYNKCVCVIKDARYTYFPNGSWWVYDIDNGSFTAVVAEKDIEGIVVPPSKGKRDTTPKKTPKRKN